MTWRSLTHDAVGGADGLAVDEALLSGYGRSATGDFDATLRLYTYRDSALVGRYQDADAEVDLAACAQLGVDVARRPTGGGAIVMGPGQLGVAVATRSDPARRPVEMLRAFADAVIDGLSDVGVPSRFRGKNDLEVDGRKIAGLGLYLDPDGAVLFHASVLVDLDITRMLRLLRIPGAKVSDKGIARVAERVTTVSREIGQRLVAGDVRPAIERGFHRAFGVTMTPDDLTDDERRRADELVRDKYGDDDWTHQRSPRRDARGSTTIKTPAGLVRVYVALHGDAIKSALLCGDFNALPDGVARLEAELKWCSVDEARVRGVVDAALTHDDLGVPPSHVADAILAAADEARALVRSHPVRAAGSCYAPEPGSKEQR